MSPTAAKRPCLAPGCPNLVTLGRCALHTRQQNQERRPPWITAFYNSTAWKKVRAMKRRMNPMCEAQGPDCTHVATSVDHKVSLMENRSLALVLENLQSLCDNCHGQKTARPR